MLHYNLHSWCHASWKHQNLIKNKCTQNQDRLQPRMQQFHGQLHAEEGMLYWRLLYNTRNEEKLKMWMKHHQNNVFLMNYLQNLSVFTIFLLIRVWQGLAFWTPFFHNYPTSKNVKNLFYKVVCFSSYFDETDWKINHIINIFVIFIDSNQ